MGEITTLLIANRGEIASRILRTARCMGIRTAVVFAEPDYHAPYVREADIAVPLISSSVTDAYLDQAQILTIARKVGANAIHPGYGFLSEQAAFAQACVEAGFLWIGPPHDVLSKMSQKLLAKQIASTAGLPVLPGVVISSEDETAWQRAARSIGYPLLVKTNASGGGKGIRLVETPIHLTDAMREVQHFTNNSFGETTVFLEHRLSAPRHIEVQVLADSHGSIIHLYERDGSIQRRYQKVIEQAPTHCISPRLLQQMREAAIELARGLGYVGAGTVEYLVDGDRFFFLEMNPRLQMEHPVTEGVTDLDLVQLQLQVASGEPLPLRQQQVHCSGYALEARLYAEDPTADFRRTFGRLEHFELGTAPGIRYETAVESGQTITHYGLLAKVIAHAPTRTEAAYRLVQALGEIRVCGLCTNRDFLIATLLHPDFLAGDTHTEFVNTHPELLSGQFKEGNQL